LEYLVDKAQGDFIVFNFMITDDDASNGILQL